MFALCLLFALAFAAPLQVVVFNDDMSVAELESHITAVLGDVQPKYVYKHVFRGFAAELSPIALSAVQKHPKFKYMEEDKIAHILACESSHADSWGLSRISQRVMDLDDVHWSPQQAGHGVTAYILDTGIYVAHKDFENRARFGFKAEAGWSNTDGNGHGTHVASTVGGKDYGVAKKVHLVAVKVLSDGGSGSYAGVIAGVEWALDDYLIHHGTDATPGVVNMSLGGPLFQPLNDALTAAMRAGLFCVVAAGNDNGDACRTSPASAKDVITVGATDQTALTPPTDIRSYFSSFGPCVDVFAPGSDITGAWIGGPDASRTISGTSMASPHVCGVAALLYGANPKLRWDEATTLLTDSTATKGAVDLNCGGNTVCQQSPNSFVFNGCHHAPK